MGKPSRYNVVVPESGGALLFNVRTGSLIRLDAERLRQVEGGTGIPADFEQFLLAQGFLVPDEADELALIARDRERVCGQRRIFSATVELTTACNFRCAYCYQDHEPGHLTEHTAERVVRYLVRKMEPAGHLHVNWFGGEPLLRLPLLAAMSRRLAKESRSRNASFSQFMTTNGYLVTKAVADRVGELGISNIQITVDGARSSHDRLRVLVSGGGTYARVLAGCANVVAAGIELLVRINVSHWSAQTVERLLQDLAERGISPRNTVIHAVRAVDHGNCGEAVARGLFDNAEFAKEWVRILSLTADRGYRPPPLSPAAYNCAFDLAQTVMIGKDGKLRHCTSSDGVLAELTEDGREIRRTALHDAVKRRAPTDDATCRECLYLPMCMGGCSYLQEIGREKCNPERYALPDLIRLTARQAKP